MKVSLPMIYYKMASPEVPMNPQYTIITMRTAREIGVVMFEGEDDPESHRVDGVGLKQGIADANHRLAVGNIDEERYDELLKIWVQLIEEYSDKWSPYRVPFDIRDVYNQCNESIGRQARIWPEKIEIKVGVDFELPIFTMAIFTHIE